MKLFEGFRIRVSERRTKWDKRALESKLVKYINLMEAHKAADLPAGHPYYVTLNAKATADILNFCRVHSTYCYDDIAVGVPPLVEMKRLAAGKTGSNFLGVGIVAVTVILTATILAAGCHNLYVYLTGLVH